MLCCCSLAMPIPVSVTAKLTVPSSPGWIDRVTRPLSVNLIALDSRFFKTCSSRCGSVSMVRATAGATSTANARCLSSARGWNTCRRLPTSRSTATVSGRISTWPASILDRSRMSLIRFSRSLPEDWMVLAYFTCSAVRFSSGLSASSLARISDEFSGVRSSCDMLARKSDLYWLACSSSRAFSSTEILTRSRSSRCVSNCWACSSSWALVCSSSTCCCSSRACDSLRARLCSSSSSLETRNSSLWVCSSSAWRCVSSSRFCSSPR